MKSILGRTFGAKEVGMKPVDILCSIAAYECGGHVEYFTAVGFVRYLFLESPQEAYYFLCKPFFGGFIVEFVVTKCFHRKVGHAFGENASFAERIDKRNAVV